MPSCLSVPLNASEYGKLVQRWWWCCWYAKTKNKGSGINYLVKKPCEKRKINPKNGGMKINKNKNERTEEV